MSNESRRLVTSVKPVIQPIPIDEWRAEALRRGKGNFLDTRFVCPACGHVATPRDFQNLGDDPNRAPQECIGRAMNRKGAGDGEVGEWGRKSPCNWAAFGLFGTLDGGQTVVMPDGQLVNVFDFARD